MLPDDDVMAAAATARTLLLTRSEAMDAARHSGREHACDAD